MVYRAAANIQLSASIRIPSSILDWIEGALTELDGEELIGKIKEEHDAVQTLQPSFTHNKKLFALA